MVSSIANFSTAPFPLPKSNALAPRKSPESQSGKVSFGEIHCAYLITGGASHQARFDLAEMLWRCKHPDKRFDLVEKSNAVLLYIADTAAELIPGKYPKIPVINIEI